MTNSPTVYLAGLISTFHPESLAWRLRTAHLLRHRGIRPITPMRGKDDLAKASPDGGITDPERTPAEIVLRDFHDVQDCDLILVHLDSFGSPRPLVGTLYELAWGWYLRKKIVAICSSDNILMRTHPFVVETVARFCKTEEEAVEAVVAFL